MTKRVTEAQAQAELLQLLAEAADGGERIIIERPGKPAAAQIRAAELPPLGEEAPTEQAQEGFLSLVGAWAGLLTNEEIDAMTEEIYDLREREMPRPFAQKVQTFYF